MARAETSANTQVVSLRDVQALYVSRRACGARACSALSVSRMGPVYVTFIVEFSIENVQVVQRRAAKTENGKKDGRDGKKERKGEKAKESKAGAVSELSNLHAETTLTRLTSGVGQNAEAQEVFAEHEARR